MRPLVAAVLVVSAMMIAPNSHADEDFWVEILDLPDEPTKYDLAMSTADEFAIRAARAFPSNRYQGRAHARRAAFEYEKAAKLEPTKGEPHFRAAEVLYAHFASPDTKVIDEDETKRAIEHWKQWRELEPKDPRLVSALFRRSLAYTKLGGETNYKLALRDYEDQLALTDSASSGSRENVAIIMSNAAELYMAVGDLDNSITMYKQALDVSDRPLYGAGLAIALERDGQATKAREVMQHYLRGKPFTDLITDTVFFIPEGDAHAYSGLAFDANGQYREAAAHYRTFLEYQPDGRYSELVQKRLKVVAGKAAADNKKPSKLQFEPETWNF